MKFLLSPVPSLCQPLSISIPICQARDPTGTPRHLQSMLSLVVAMTTPPLTAGLLVGREIQKFTFPGSLQGPVGVSWGAPYLTVFAEAMCWLRTGQTATGKSLVGKSKEGETRGRGQCHVGGRRPKKRRGWGFQGLAHTQVLRTYLCGLGQTLTTMLPFSHLKTGCSAHGTVGSTA